MLIGGKRELAYIVQIDVIEPIVGSDNCEAAVVGGWKIMTKKETFKAGDYAVYFEIDSQVPQHEPFMFLAKKHFKVKTQKYTFGGKGNFISQGLLMSLDDFGDAPWVLSTKKRIEDGKDVLHEGLTEILGVIYADAADNKRKGASIDKYKAMAQRRPDIFRQGWAKWLMRRTWGKKLMFLLFGKKKDTKKQWPAWVKKTDEERCQNLPHLFPGDGREWIATEKIDGTSTTFTMKRLKRNKYDFFVCSRNVVFDKPDKKCFYDTNVYLEMAEKYDIENKMIKIMEEYPELEYLTIQGETYGAGIQKREYSTPEHHFMAFNLIFGVKNCPPSRFNPIQMTNILLKRYGIPCVPIVSESFVIPETCEELLLMAEGESIIDGGMREGLVFRSYDGQESFKAVSNPFLLKYHS